MCGSFYIYKYIRAEGRIHFTKRIRERIFTVDIVVNHVASTELTTCGIRFSESQICCNDTRCLYFLLACVYSECKLAFAPTMIKPPFYFKLAFVSKLAL